MVALEARSQLALLGELVKGFDQGFPLEGQSRIMAEGPEPRSLVWTATQMPMDQPRRSRVFHIGVKSVRAEQALSKSSGYEPVLVGCLLNDARRRSPMAHGGNHILTNAESGDGVFAREDRPVVVLVFGCLDGVKSLF